MMEEWKQVRISNADLSQELHYIPEFCQVPDAPTYWLICSNQID